MGSKVPKPSHPTWAIVTLAGGAYAYHGVKIGDGKIGLHWGAIATFAALKFAVAKKVRPCEEPTYLRANAAD